MIFTTKDCSREEVERRLALSIRRNREQLNHYRSRAVDAMTWKQYLVFSRTGVFQGKSKRVTRWLDLISTTLLEMERDRKALDRLLSLEVLDGGRHAWLPSNRSSAPLRVVANA